MTTTQEVSPAQQDVAREIASGLRRYKRTTRRTRRYAALRDDVVMTFKRNFPDDHWKRTHDTSTWLLDSMVRDGLAVLGSDSVYVLTAAGGDVAARALEAQRAEQEQRDAERKKRNEANRIATEAADKRRAAERAKWRDVLTTFVASASPAEIVDFITANRQRGGLDWTEAPLHIRHALDDLDDAGRPSFSTLREYLSDAAKIDDARREAYKATMGHYPGEW